MVKINVTYLGGLKCSIEHEPSGETFKTDAPLDHKGKAEFISPTDLLAASLASCSATIMGMRAEESGIDINGTEIQVFKEMENNPVRKIKSLTLNIIFPYKLDDKTFNIMSKVVEKCPVFNSLHPSIEIYINYSFRERL